MRDYGKVSPHFWTGSTGKKLRECPDSIVVAMYLMTCPHANMLGLYYMPLLYVAHETGLGLEGAKKGLKWACDAGFCSYDEVSEMVWVHEMARFQVAESLKPTDNRCKGIQKDYDSLPANPFLSSFYEKYATAFCMTNRREGKGTLSLSNLAPSKPLVSQEQEQEQEQDKSLSQAPAQNFKEPDDSWKPNIEHLCTILQKSKYSQRVQEILLMDDYEFHLSNFNAHHETNRYLTDNQKHSKFAQWLFEKFEKQETQKAKQTKPANPTQSQGGSVNQAFDQQQPDYDENVQPVKLGGNFV
ncbi:TPA: hypothetical protein OXK24_000336 [Acinetobacter baumannii]|uniref:hypothetical protein n=1 Tax=Acinetobacter calcoaceticus/baumannii complex TaxID=909768 RepID=UPI00021B787D|nr:MULTISPECIES: hypothetical protein [Acinetobacter calcoaceticus/baumannii complex]EXD21295.1 hypothetical protein J480_4049 [Acinetobacter baumannii 34654]KCW28419.1 hypothetical protein J474_3903 [Acinetobacter baumannii 6935]EGU03082.1 hypothetical protein ABNIH4_05749 [Acinetobacter baumannii ABNIH4]EIB7230196.1 hypothetical protein [Acinetobacter baumannii]EIB7254214.1 hypothetical protein [Acinetobacter baumannii]